MSESLWLGLQAEAFGWDFKAGASADETQKPLDALDIARRRGHGLAEPALALA